MELYSHTLEAISDDCNILVANSLDFSYNGDLNLECEDDDLYELPLPPPPQKAPLAKGIDVRLEISFPMSNNESNQLRFSCDQCDKTFSRESVKNDHRFKAHGVAKQFSCEHCNYVGNLNRLLQKHIAKVHRQKGSDAQRQNSDGVAEEDVKEGTYENNRVVSNDGKSKGSQELCDKDMATDNTCSVCHKCIKSAHYLKIHMRLHEVGKEFYKCSLCDKNCVSKSMLNVHEKSHQERRHFCCKIKGCKAMFKNISALNFHVKRTHKEKKLKCSVEGCGKIYACPSQLKNHVRSHMLSEQKNEYHCDMCYKCFSREITLKNHKYAAHGVEGQYQCVYCSYVGNNSYNLKSHHARYCKGTMDSSNEIKDVT